jgi:hypothetical protein
MCCWKGNKQLKCDTGISLHAAEKTKKGQKCTDASEGTLITI